MYTKSQYFAFPYEVGETFEIIGGGGAVFLIVFFLSGRLGLATAISILVTILSLAFHWATFYKLTVSVDQQSIKIRYGVGLFKREFQLSNIEECEILKDTVRSELLSSFTFWGTYFWPVEKLFSVSTRTIALPMLKWPAVQIKIGGEHINIGTNDPEGLREAISRASKV